jgi:formylglycine-generating enzyme required for sulfatase activity
MICSASKCVCRPDLEDCSGICRDLKIDQYHCGACGKTCPAGHLCINSQCLFNWLYEEEVLINSGTFTMGSPTNEIGRDGNEIQHTVTLTRMFAIGKYEVTQGEFEKLMGYNPSFHKPCGPKCPVDHVTWHEAVAFLNALSKNRGLDECFECTGSQKNVLCKVKSNYSDKNYYNCKGYRLPTEAEWEYAYRSGTKTALYNGDIVENKCGIDVNLEKIAWYCGNSNSNTHQVGQKEANAWGLYDMAGNVWEWVYDFHGDYDTSTSPSVDPVGINGSNRVRRGGCYGRDSTAKDCRAAQRSSDTPTNHWPNVGFRFLRSISITKTP